VTNKNFPLILNKTWITLSEVKEIMNMKKLNVTIAILVAAVMAGNAQTVTSDVVGYVNQTFAAGSDTIVVPQLLRPAEFVGAVNSVSVSGGNATLTCPSATFSPNSFQYVAVTQPKTYYAMVTSGNLTGTGFLVVSNGTGDFTVALDGLTATSADITGIEVRPLWTLNTLFPSSSANITFTPSTGTTTGNRRTQLVMPNFTGTGINRAASAVYFYNPAVSDWVATTATGTKAGDTPLVPSQYLIHRNTGGTPVQLTASVVGSVFSKPGAMYLGTLTTASNDTPCGLPRPTDYKLSELGLDDTNFMQSTGTTTGTRRDQVLVYSTTGSGINRSPTAVYFKTGGTWRATTASTTPVDPVIPAGSAMIIRKYQSDGNDKVVVNNLNVSL
jgi:uncharacterized protein (TIGR02597 family)